jgi:hypothetical protein
VKRDILRLKVIVKSEEVGDDVDKLQFIGEGIANESLPPGGRWRR